MIPGPLRWRCRRGLRELDALLLNYLDHHFQQAPLEEQRLFERWLERTDPELWNQIMGPVQGDPLERQLWSKLQGLKEREDAAE